MQLYDKSILRQALIVARGEKEQLELQLNRLQHKVKDLGEDYRGRLIKYVEDIAVSTQKSVLAAHLINRGISLQSHPSIVKYKCSTTDNPIHCIKCN